MNNSLGCKCMNFTHLKYSSFVKSGLNVMKIEFLRVEISPLSF